MKNTKGYTLKLCKMRYEEVRRPVYDVRPLCH